ncbi:AAA family ATPase [Corynebacterium sp. HMSC05E07]|uniref:AAA family ATPase n=1 Tax=Corynebacterium sp. HMSC05E07 TaxID=1581117 RepID=UPI0008A13947|nr:AAA family ATPase [Corynebacterium sp. HMSC05E07]OFT59286.1 hypothetical protein HMPREF3149_10205 [Corynebacterium sp. HMSC05E07]
MLNALDVGKIHCFAPDATLNHLRPNSFIFAPNGSGKTSITRFLANLSSSPDSAHWSGEPKTLRIFNSDYQRETFATSELNGVFLLGRNSIELDQQISQARSDLRKAEDRKTQHTNTLATKEKELKDLKAATQASLKDLRNTLPKSIRDNWRGSKRVDRLWANSLDAYTAEQTEPSWTDLAEKAELLFDSNALPFTIPPRPGPWSDDASNLEMFTELLDLLRKPLIPAKEVPFMQIIKDFDLSDWVATGSNYVNQMHLSGEDRCPFCQQALPEGFELILDQVFDTHYTTSKRKLTDLQREITALSQSISEYIDTHSASFASVGESSEYQSRCASLTGALADLISLVDQKILEPSRPLEAVDPRPVITLFLESVEERIDQMERQNTLLSRRRTEQDTWLDEVWAGFANGTAFETLKAFHTKSAPLEKAIGKLTESIRQDKATVGTRATELRKLEARTVSSESTIAKINSMLERCQFHSFRLDRSDSKQDGYTVVRVDGSRADPLTLSEGERTFITFLYFYQSLSAVATDDQTERLVAVIDDPISSLDYSIMFVVSSLIRSLLGKIRSGTHPRLDQAIVLTHNPRFHNEVAYRLDRCGPQAVSHHKIKKLAPQPNQIEYFADTNPVRTSYQELWAEVANLEGKEQTTPGWLPNILRRILESYFTTLGGEDNLYDLANGWTHDEKIVHHSLTAWSHSGSHDVIMSDDFNIASESCKVWLDAFKAIFEKTGHQEHYKMMMSRSVRPEAVER